MTEKADANYNDLYSYGCLMTQMCVNVVTLSFTFAELVTFKQIRSIVGGFK